MTKSRSLLALAFAACMSCSLAFAQVQKSTGPAGSGGMGGAMEKKSGMDDVNRMTGSQKTPNQILRDINSGNEISEEDAATLVMSSGFMKEISVNPRVAEAVANHPFAANMFYMGPQFKEWSQKDPEMAKRVMDAAMEWEQMSQEEKDKFFAEHKNLRSLKTGEGDAKNKK